MTVLRRAESRRLRMGSPRDCGAFEAPHPICAAALKGAGAELTRHRRNS